MTEVQPGGSRPRRAWPLKRLLASAAGLSLVAVLVGWFFLHQRDTGPPPLPHELEARAALWGKAWLANDHYLMRRLTDPACDRSLHPWLLHHPPPQAPAAPTTKEGGAEAEVEAHVDSSAGHGAVLVIRIKAPSQKAPVEVRQNWVERGDGWFFTPS